MSKCFLLVSLSVAVLRPAECLFSGDSCFAEERPGSCSLLSRCQPLLDEIRNAGTPITPTLRRRLQALSCGFELNEPLVCCVSPYTNSNNQDTGDTQPWNSNSGTRIPPRPSMTTIGPWTTPGTTWTIPDDRRTTPQDRWTTPDNRRTTPQDRWTTVDDRRTTPQDRWTTLDDRRTTPQDRWTTPDNRRTTPQDRWTTPDNRRTTPQDRWTTLDDRRTTRPSVSPNSNNRPPADVQGHRNLRLLPENCGVIETDRIWGGNRTRLYEMPWMVLISYDSPRGPKLSCGGTLISERYVLTAAHCVSFLGNKLTLSGVVLGEYDVRSDPDCEREEGELHCAPSIRNATIETVIPHPGYSPQNLYDDIALLRLAQPADFSLDNMKPICLPFTRELQNEQLVGKSGVVAGWGATEDGLQSPVLLSVSLPIVSNKDCQEAYNGSPKIYARQMCAGGVEDKDSCGGDSGGPLMYPGHLHSRGLRYIQHGIVSYGSKRCGLGGYPGVYTRVAHYVDWILDNMTG